MTMGGAVAVMRHEERMALFTVEELLEVISAKVLAGQEPEWIKRRIRQVVTDSRLVRPGDLFVALKGERFDGQQFVPAVLARGAVGAIVHDQFRVPPDLLKPGKRPGRSRAPFILGARDTLFAYQQLATHHRSRFDIPVVAVTGSNGKTTTKDMVASVLAQRWKTLKTEGNLNNRIGVPQTLFRLTADHEAAVVEMGVDAAGQTTRLCDIARPTVGVITNIGPDHLEFFGSMEGSAQAKAELLDLLPADGTAVLNVDDPYYDYLASRARCRVVSFGFAPKADVRAQEVRSDEDHGTLFRLVLPGKARTTPVRIQARGQHNVSNALAAAAVGVVLELPGAVIAQGLARFRPAAMRSQIVRCRGVEIINDCYNANPASMKAALALLGQIGEQRRKIAVLGDMLELGAGAKDMHRDVGAFAAGLGLTRLVACGPLGREIAEGARRAGMDPNRVVEVPDGTAGGEAVKGFAQEGDVVLVKASRGMRLERVVEALTGSKRPTQRAS